MDRQCLMHRMKVIFSNMRILPEYIHGIKVWKGAEANIVDYEGRIDLTEHTLGRLECIVASFHEQTFQGRNS